MTGRLQSLLARDGGLQIEVDGVPDFLIEANEAVRLGHGPRADQLLSDAHQDCVRRIVRQDPSRTDVMFILAKLLADRGRSCAAETWYRRILEVEPHAQVYDPLSRICFQDETRWSEAAEYSRRAWEAMPGDPALALHHAWGLVRTGRIEEGVRIFEHAVTLNPDCPETHTSALWFAHYLKTSRQQVLQGYRRWAERFAHAAAGRRTHANVPDPDRRIRIGYLSPDFRRHSVAYAFEPILEGHDRGLVELYGYGNVARPDRITERFMTHFDIYRQIHGQDAGTVAARIEQDRIDILVEIAGHVTDSRMDVVALKPAPIQADFGGISTTGMVQVGYRLTDECLDPPDTLGYYVERLVYLSGGQACFRPPSSSPQVGPLPARTPGAVTFGSFTSHGKINPDMVALWAKILRDTPAARMILKFKGGADLGIQGFYRRQFELQGVSSGRVEIFGWMPFQEHMALFNRVDLLLDTYPYNGAITTMEGLWMGVPVLTLTGDTFVSRMGRNILKRLDLEVFAADTPEEYVDKANAFAGQLKELALIRGALRSMMLASPLCDPNRISRELEKAFRGMWVSWCDSRIENQKSKIKNEESVLSHSFQGGLTR